MYSIYFSWSSEKQTDIYRDLNIADSIDSINRFLIPSKPLCESEQNFFNYCPPYIKGEIAKIYNKGSVGVISEIIGDDLTNSRKICKNLIDNSYPDYKEIITNNRDLAPESCLDISLKKDEDYFKVGHIISHYKITKERLKVLQNILIQGLYDHDLMIFKKRENQDDCSQFTYQQSECMRMKSCANSVSDDDYQRALQYKTSVLNNTINIIRENREYINEISASEMDEKSIEAEKIHIKDLEDKLLEQNPELNTDDLNKFLDPKQVYSKDDEKKLPIHLNNFNIVQRKHVLTLLSKVKDSFACLDVTETNSLNHKTNCERLDSIQQILNNIPIEQLDIKPSIKKITETYNCIASDIQNRKEVNDILDDSFLSSILVMLPLVQVKLANLIGKYSGKNFNSTILILTGGIYAIDYAQALHHFKNVNARCFVDSYKIHFPNKEGPALCKSSERLMVESIVKQCEGNEALLVALLAPMAMINLRGTVHILKHLKRKSLPTIYFSKSEKGLQTLYMNTMKSLDDINKHLILKRSNRKAELPDHLIKNYNDSMVSFGTYLSSLKIESKLLPSKDYYPLYNIQITKVPKNASKALRLYFETIKKKTNGTGTLEISPIENFINQTRGFYEGWTNRVDIGLPSLVSALRGFTSTTGTHELRHLINNQRDLHPFAIKFFANRNHLLSGLTEGSTNHRKFYEYYMSSDEIYTHSSDLRVLGAKLLLADNKKVVKNLKSLIKEKLNSLSKITTKTNNLISSKNISNKELGKFTIQGTDLVLYKTDSLGRSIEMLAPKSHLKFAQAPDNISELKKILNTEELIQLDQKLKTIDINDISVVTDELSKFYLAYPAQRIFNTNIEELNKISNLQELEVKKLQKNLMFLSNEDLAMRLHQLTKNVRIFN